MPLLSRLLLTGAAGTLGRQLRPALLPVCAQLRLSDRTPTLGDGAPPLAPQETYQRCELGDAAAVHAMLEGVQAVAHFGGAALEGPPGPILEANVHGLVHLYEAARRHGVRRIVLASSNHVTGGYPQGERIDARQPARPDGFYGASKLFGEGLASMYHTRHGIESVCLRIGTATPEPPDRRALATWISPRDLATLVLAALTAPDVGCLVTYGASANPAGWWDCAADWARLGYSPQDSAEAWRDRIEGITPPPGSPMARLQGGSFLGIGPFALPGTPPADPHS